MSYILLTCPVVYLSVGYSSYVSHSIYMCHIWSNYMSYSLPMCHVQSSHLSFGLYVSYSLATCLIVYLDVLHSIDTSCSLSKCHVIFSLVLWSTCLIFFLHVLLGTNVQSLIILDHVNWIISLNHANRLQGLHWPFTLIFVIDPL
jgi:hypothetical protein